MNNKFREDRGSFITLLAFLLNYSRGLVDNDANFMREFVVDMDRLEEIVD